VQNEVPLALGRLPPQQSIVQGDRQKIIN